MINTILLSSLVYSFIMNYVIKKFEFVKFKVVNEYKDIESLMLKYKTLIIHDHFKKNIIFKTDEPLSYIVYSESSNSYLHYEVYEDGKDVLIGVLLSLFDEEKFNKIKEIKNEELLEVKDNMIENEVKSA